MIDKQAEYNIDEIVNKISPLLAGFGVGKGANSSLLKKSLKAAFEKEYTQSGGKTSAERGVNTLKTFLGEDNFNKYLKDSRFGPLLNQITGVVSGVFDTSLNADSIINGMITKNLMPINSRMNDHQIFVAERYNKSLYSAANFVKNTINSGYEDGDQNRLTGGLSYQDFASVASAAYSNGLITPKMSESDIHKRIVNSASFFNVMKRMSGVKNPNEVFRVFNNFGLSFDKAYKSSLDLYRSAEAIGMPESDLKYLLVKSMKTAKAEGRIGVNPFDETRKDVLDVYRAKEISTRSGGRLDANSIYADLRKKRSEGEGARNILKGAFLILKKKGKSDEDISKFLDIAVNRAGNNKKSLLSFMKSAGMTKENLYTSLTIARDDVTNKDSEKVQDFFGNSKVFEKLMTPGSQYKNITYKNASDGMKSTMQWKLKDLAHKWGYDTKGINTYNDMVMAIDKNDKGSTYTANIAKLRELDKKYGIRASEALRDSLNGNKTEMLIESRAGRAKDMGMYGVSNLSNGGVESLTRAIANGKLKGKGILGKASGLFNSYIGTPDNLGPEREDMKGLVNNSLIDYSENGFLGNTMGGRLEDTTSTGDTTIKFDRKWKNRKGI